MHNSNDRYVKQRDPQKDGNNLLSDALGNLEFYDIKNLWAFTGSLNEVDRLLRQ
jgi:hypothetical protein